MTALLSVVISMLHTDFENDKVGECCEKKNYKHHLCEGENIPSDLPGSGKHREANSKCKRVSSNKLSGLDYVIFPGMESDMLR